MEMETVLLEKIEEQGKKIDALYTSVEKMRKYFLWTLWITIILFVLPLIGLALVLPWFASTMLNSYGSIGL
jgi:hypothetical protein